MLTELDTRSILLSQPIVAKSSKLPFIEIKCSFLGQGTGSLSKASMEFLSTQGFQSENRDIHFFRFPWSSFEISNGRINSRSAAGVKDEESLSNASSSLITVDLLPSGMRSYFPDSHSSANEKTQGPSRNGFRHTASPVSHPL